MNNGTFIAKALKLILMKVCSLSKLEGQAATINSNLRSSSLKQLFVGKTNDHSMIGPCSSDNEEAVLTAKVCQTSGRSQRPPRLYVVMSILLNHVTQW